MYIKFNCVLRCCIVLVLRCGMHCINILHYRTQCYNYALYCIALCCIVFVHCMIYIAPANFVTL